MTARRLTPLFLVLVLALVAAGCGGDDPESGTLAEPLSYLPKDAALVVTFDTDTSGEQFKNLDRHLGKFPFGGQVKSQLRQSLGESGNDYDKDVKPLLGNQLVVGLLDARAVTDNASEDVYVAAFEAKDGDKLREVVGKDKDLTKSNKIGDADVWQSQDGSVVAVKGKTAVAASDRPQLEAALERPDGDDKLTEDEFNAPFEGLPGEPMMRVYGDAQALLESDPETATARQVKWVAGMRKFAMTGNVEGDGLSLDGRVVTEGVTEQDLPMAAGDQAPALARFADYSVALRDPSQMFRFAQSTAEKTDPEGFREFAADKERLGQKLNIDVDRDLIDQLNGDTTVAGGLDGSWSLRGGVKDPAAMKETLDKMADAGTVGDTTFSRSGDLVQSSGDGDPVYFGMVDDIFVAGPSPDAAKQMADVEAKPLPGAKGAATSVADGEAIAKAIIARSGQNQAAGLFTGPIGDVTAYASAEPGGLRWHAKLKIE